MTLLSDTVNADELTDDGSGSVSLLSTLDGGGSPIQVGDNLDLGGSNTLSNPNQINFGSNSGGSILTQGGGTDRVRVYDNANGVSLMEWHEGGPVEVKNSDLNVGGNFDVQANGDLQFHSSKSNIFDANALRLMTIHQGGPVQVDNAQFHAQSVVKVDYDNNSGDSGGAASPALHVGGNGAGFYVSNGELYAVDEAGNGTQLT